MRHQSTALGLLLASTLPFGLAAQVRPSRNNWVQLAETVVKRSWQLAPGERVVFVWEPGSDRGMAQALREAVTRSGAVVSAELVAPTAATEKAAASLSEKERAALRRAEADAWATTFKNADVAIWLPAPLGVTDQRPFEHAVERSKVRSIHFHWFLPSETRDAATTEAMYAKAIAVAPATLDTVQAGIETALRGATVHLTAPNGTDLTFTIPKNAWFHRNTGDASRKKVAHARSVRDREEELPAGVVRTTGVNGAEGTITGNVTFDTRTAQITATFHAGKATGLVSKRGADEIVKEWEAATGNKDLVGEFVVGTNPELAATLPSGFMPYYGYGAGVVRLAIGDNWESGGKNRSSNGELLLFLTNATVTANGRTLVKDGKLVR